MAEQGFAMDVEGLHQTGRTISGRSTGGGSAAKSLRDGLDGASGTVGHHSVKTAFTSFVTDHVIDHANKLPTQIENGGTNVSNTSSTARSEDNEKAGAVRAPVANSEGYSSRINRQIH